MGTEETTHSQTSGRKEKQSRSHPTADFKIFLPILIKRMSQQHKERLRVEGTEKAVWKRTHAHKVHSFST